MSQTDLKIPRSQNQLIYDTCAFQKDYTKVLLL